VNFGYEKANNDEGVKVGVVNNDNHQNKIS